MGCWALWNAWNACRHQRKLYSLQRLARVESESLAVSSQVWSQSVTQLMK